MHIRLFVYSYSFIRFSCQIGSGFNCNCSYGYPLASLLNHPLRYCTILSCFIDITVAVVTDQAETIETTEMPTENVDATTLISITTFETETIIATNFADHNPTETSMQQTTEETERDTDSSEITASPPDPTNDFVTGSFTTEQAGMITENSDELATQIDESIIRTMHSNDVTVTQEKQTTIEQDDATTGQADIPNRSTVGDMLSITTVGDERTIGNAEHTTHDFAGSTESINNEFSNEATGERAITTVAMDIAFTEPQITTLSSGIDVNDETSVQPDATTIEADQQRELVTTAETPGDDDTPTIHDATITATYEDAGMTTMVMVATNANGQAPMTTSQEAVEITVVPRTTVDSGMTTDNLGIATTQSEEQTTGDQM